jgi:hypothetical protein
MNDHWLPSDVKALLDAERGHAEIPSAAKARLARKLAPSLHAAVGAKAMAGWKAFVLKGTLVVAAAGGAVALADHARRDVPATVEVAPPPPSTMVAPVVARVVAAEPSAPPPEVASVSSPAPIAIKRAKPVDPIERLEAERKVLDEARDALQRAEPALALDATDRHATQFARGTLTEERCALRVRALARLGRKDDARAAASDMAARFPRSFLLEGAMRDAESIP